ncbi:MAG: FAD-binding protein, partial [Acidobacteria bacterium]|nr:FAD-binding protein [Acidobacteriota bacterium]
TGDGIAMAWRAGCRVANMEFVQFHPTALNLENAPRFLLSEAMRGEGAILRNAHGTRFMGDYDERLELAPRDIVSRSIVTEMRKTGTRTVYLDITAKGEEFLKHRFPKIYETCKYFGLDIAKDLLPVSPASHYCMGGVRTDLWGRTTVEGLYAAGEVTCTGVHGANRLASNSLLEGLVFGARSGSAAVRDTENFKFQSFDLTGGNVETGKQNKREKEAEAGGSKPKVRRPQSDEIATAVKKRVKRVMWERVGIMRDRDSLTRALKEFNQISNADLSGASRNFVLLAMLVTKAALWREESRGGHFRTDFPETLDTWQLHSIQKQNSDISTSEKINFGADTFSTNK